MKKIDTISIVVILGILVLFIYAILYLPYIPSPPPPFQPTENKENLPSCEELLEIAKRTAFEECQSIDINQLCYGFFNIIVQLVSENTSRFTMPGDTISLNQVLTFTTSPIDLVAETWGISIFKLQANYPGTSPGKDVTFQLFGDIGLYNYSGDMYRFYFSTGLGSTVCPQILEVIKVIVPEGSGITFTANDAEISLEGDAVLIATPGESMSVTMLSGIGTVTAGSRFRTVQTLQAGEILLIPLSDNLESEGPPSIPEPISPGFAFELCLLTDNVCDPDDPFLWISTPVSGD